MLITHKTFKIDNGRVTIQINSFGIPELKVRVGEQSGKVRLPYEDTEQIERVVKLLLSLREST